MIINNTTDYPLFKKGQQLKSSSLKGIVDFAEREDQNTRVYLEGSGIFYGLTVNWNPGAGTLTLSPGTAVTSDGQLFSVEDEIVYNGIIKDVKVSVMKRTATVMVLSTENDNHNEFVQYYGGTNPDTGVTDTTEYLLVLVVRSDETSVPSCLYGYDNNETTKSLEVEAALIRKDFFKPGELEAWGQKDITGAGEHDPVVHRFGYTKKENGNALISFERFTDWGAVCDGFNDVCAAAEPGLETACVELYKLVKDKLILKHATNPFEGLAGKLAALREKIKANQPDSRHFPWLYDYYKDLVATYQEIVSTDVFSFLSWMPDQERFHGYVALDSVRAKDANGKPVTYRMGLYRPPFADLSVNALQRPRFLVERLIHLADLANNRLEEATLTAYGVKFTPDAGIHKTLSERAIPFYYKDPEPLSRKWNADLARTGRAFSIPGITDAKDYEYCLSDMNGYTFYRIKGHLGKTADDTQTDIQALRAAIHLPFDIKIVYLGTDDMLNGLINESASAFSDLQVMLEKIVNDIRCTGACSHELEETVFNGKFDRNDIGGMFEKLVDLFGREAIPDIDKWAEEYCTSEGTCADEDKTCCRAHISSLYVLCREYIYREDQLAESLLFHRFAESHPGLEHNGGVPRGGTLVLVCAQQDVNTLAAGDVSNLMKMMLSNDKEAIAAGKNMAAELLTYRVVADFCLPYICCSDKPAVKVEFQTLPPSALFSVAKLDPLPENEGFSLVLKNESLRASKYYWQLLDFKGDQVDEKGTEDLSTPAEFKLFLQNGAVYTVWLTAWRDGLLSKYEEVVTVCPQGHLQLTSNGNSPVEWELNSGVMNLPLEVAPYGGTFSLKLVEDEKAGLPVYNVSWTDNKETALLTVQQPLPGTYELRYAFEGLKDCKEAEIILSIKVIEINNDKQLISTDRQLINTEAVFNKRFFTYRDQVNALGKSDAALKEDSRFSDTTSFLLASGTPEKMQEAYEHLLGSLQTGFLKLKVAQKEQVVKLLSNATAYFTDRLIAGSPDKAPAAAIKLVKAAAETIMGQKNGVEYWNSVWKPAEIITKENEKTVAAYSKLIK